MELLIALVVFGVVSGAAGRHTLTRHAAEYGRFPAPVERAFGLVTTMIGEDPRGGPPLEGTWLHQVPLWCLDWQAAKGRLAEAQARREHVDARVPEWELEDGQLVAATISVPMSVDVAPGSRFRRRFPARWEHAFPHAQWELGWRADNAVECTTLEPLPETVELDGVSDVWWRVPIGVSQEGAVTWDMTRHPHLLAAGRTGAGKSVALRTLVTHLAEHGARIVGVDPKRVDLAWIRAFDGCQVVKPDRDPERAMAPVADKLGEIVDEMHARYDMLERGGHSSISDLEDPPEPLVVVVEELGELKDDTSAPDREWRQRAWTHLGSIAALGRAAGVHMIACTQHPYASLLSGSLRDNLAARIAVGWLPSNLSPVAVDGDQATELLDPSDPPGRGVVRLDRHQVVQVAWTPPIDAPPATDDEDGCSDEMHKNNHRRENPEGSPERGDNQKGSGWGEGDGEQLRAARIAAGLTQSQLAERIGMSQAYVSQVERSLKSASDRYRQAVVEVCGESADERERK